MRSAKSRLLEKEKGLHRCKPFNIHGAQGQNRTVDTRIFSPLLYRLSYLGPSRAVH